MANIYKNANYDLDSTGVTVVYTCPSNSRAIVKKIHCANSGAGNHWIKVYLYDSSNTTQYQIAQHTINAGNSQGIADGTFILEENDVLRLQAQQADHFTGTVAILEMNREDR
tara:strand:+ start:50 stop:385 length:336 start_codon:yes stop_codon:yes gene_type:complete